MPKQGELALGGLAKYIVQVQSWKNSLILIIILGIIVEGATYISWRSGHIPHLMMGLWLIISPALLTIPLSVGMVKRHGRKLSWDWSAFIVLIDVLTLTVCPLITLVFKPEIVWVAHASSIGIMLLVRFLFLLCIADDRFWPTSRVAIIHPILALIVGGYYFGSAFVLYGGLITICFAFGVFLFVEIVERPLEKNFGINLFTFANAFMNQTIEGGEKIEKLFEQIGEEVYVPEVSFFFSQKGTHAFTITTPSVHPGPMENIGASNLPAILHQALGEYTFVFHGASTHDYNLVTEKECEKIINVIQQGKTHATYTHTTATKPVRITYNSVSILAQLFGDCVLLLSTRSPDTTEDLDYSIGMSIMNAGQQIFPHIAFIDGHNAIPELAHSVSPGSMICYDYLSASNKVFSYLSKEKQCSFKAGVARMSVPFTREQGFGDIGILALVTEVSGSTAVYLLFDGNNMVTGTRECIRDHILSQGWADECEVATTDTHSVNRLSGFNAIGVQIPPDQFMPYIEHVVQQAYQNRVETSVSGDTRWLFVRIFGNQRISQLASTVSSFLSLLVPVILIIIFFSFLLSVFSFILLFTHAIK
jgi:putative membrane protein